jgi:hypothetical protein
LYDILGANVMNEIFSIILAIAGTLITAISFIFAIYQGRQIRKLEAINLENAWDFYRHALRSIIFLDDEIKRDETIKNNLGINQAAALLQEIAINSIKLIKRFSPKYSENEIKKWKSECKIENESQERAFKKLL